VAGQVLLMAAVFGSALIGRGWSGGYAVVAYVLGGTLLAVGLLLVSAGLTLGASLTPFPAPRAGHEITTGGAYALVRHPMYGGAILIALGWTVIFASFVGLAFTFLLAVFLDLKARREEAWLSERVSDYGAYRTRTRRKLIPFIY
jgi:protein-S-isoprenylcysteine O-methyltransferase Ste14